VLSSQQRSSLREPVRIVIVIVYAARPGSTLVARVLQESFVSSSFAATHWFRNPVVALPTPARPWQKYASMPVEYFVYVQVSAMRLQSDISPG
jgi:hypothetical protein